MDMDDVLSRAISLENLDESSNYFVINHGFGAYLKLGGDTDGYNDRKAYAREGDRGGDDRYAWRISALGDNQFSFQNYSSSGGFLFRGDQQDSGDDYRIWGHNTGTIDGSKGDRYLFRLELIDGGGEIYRMYTRAGELVKAGNKKDGDGDHEVFAQPSYNGSDRYQWVIVPVP